MAVPKYKRTLSKTEYLWQIYKLTVRVSEIVENQSKKYRSTYGDRCINKSLDALSYAIYGNEIRINSKEDFERRKDFLFKSYLSLKALVTIVDLYLEICKNKEGANISKLENNQFQIGGMIDEAILLLRGVMKYDKEKYPQYSK